MTLLAVSKTMSPDAIKAAIAAGQRDFGENYIAEGVEKIAALAAETSAIWLAMALHWACAKQ